MGVLRFILALLVVICHLSGHFGAMGGPVAVFSFYVISGYLITTILRTTYSNGFGGLVAFGVNRFLRLYPAYWSIAAFSLTTIYFWPHIASKLNGALNLPSSHIDALAQVLILGLHKIFYLNQTRFVPTAWSLNIELVYYSAIALLLGRNRWIGLTWWIASAALAIHYLAEGDAHDAYFTIWGPSICFATGSLVSHFVRHVPDFKGDSAKIVAIGAIVATAFVQDVFPATPSFALLYAAPPLTVGAILVTRSRWKSPWVQVLDGWLADLSYPIFLSHWPVAVVVASLGIVAPRLSIALLVTSLPAIILFSVLVNGFIEKPVRGVRVLVRNKARDRTLALPGASFSPVGE
jgi:peptidoglycan/LPS O-acetylase OafA/YrhL